MFDLKKRFQVITNLPTSTRLTSLKSEEFENIETTAVNGVNAEIYSIGHFCAQKTISFNRKNGLLRLIKPELNDLELGLFKKCKKMMCANRKTGVQNRSFIEKIPFHALLNIGPKEILLAYDEKDKVFGRAILRTNLFDDYLTIKNYRFTNEPESEMSEVYFIDYRYSRKIPWVNLYGFTEACIDGVALKDKELETEINKQIETFKHPYSLDFTTKWESDEVFETKDKNNGLQKCFSQFKDSLEWKDEVQIESFSETKGVLNCKIRARFVDEDKVEKEFTKSLEEIVINKLKSTQPKKDIVNIHQNKLEKDVTKIEPSSGYFTNSIKLE